MMMMMVLMRMMIFTMSGIRISSYIDPATKSFQETNIINSSSYNSNNNNLNKNLIVYELDLESLSSIIKAFADKCLTESCGRIDYLILNAGIMDISS